MMLQGMLGADRRQRALDETDKMSPALRECVQEYGFAIVQACLQAKVSNPKNIRQLVREIWDGARHPAQRRAPLGQLDWVLVQAGCPISAAALLRVLANLDLAVVPLSPNTAMMNASLNEVAGFTERVTKSEKHRRRLTAAIKAGAATIRPQLMRPSRQTSGEAA